MDLKDLDTQQGSEQGFELELTHPTTGVPLGMFITVLGRDSETYTALQDAHNRRRLDRATKTGKVARMAEDLERDALDIDVACTRSWRSGDKTFLLVDGEELTCTRENVLKVYTRPGLKWIREQVDSAIVDRANFLKR